MAQRIQKFQGGGKPRTIKRNKDNIDLDEYISRLEKNRDLLIEHVEDSLGKKLKDNEKEEIYKAYGEMLKGYDNGDLTPDLNNTSNIMSNKKYESDIKFGEYNPYNYVQNFFNDVLQKMDPVKEPDKWNSSKGLSSLVNKRLFNGKETFDKNFIYLDDDYNEETGKRGTKGRSDALIQIIPGLKTDIQELNTDDKTRESLLQSIQKFEKALKDGVIENKERLALSNIGIDPDLYFANTYEQPKEKIEKEEETEYDKALEDFNNLKKQQTTDLLKKYNQYMSLPAIEGQSLNISNWTPPAFKIRIPEELGPYHQRWNRQAMEALQNFLSTNNIYNTSKYSNEFWNSPVNMNQFGFQGIDKVNYKQDGELIPLIDPTWTNAQFFRYLMDLYTTEHEKYDQRPKLEYGRYAGQHIMNTDNGYIRLWDPYRKIMQNIPISQIDPNDLVAIYPEFKQLYTQSNKNGGILKAQFGMVFTEPVKSNEQIEAEKKEQKEQKEKEEKESNLKGKTEEKYNIDTRVIKPIKNPEDLKASDWIRLSSIGSDVIGLVSAWVPGYGTAVSAGSGLLSTIGNTTADIMEGQNFGQVVSGIGLGLGSTIMGLIPGFGSATKTAKIIKSLVKYTPLLLSVVGTAGAAPEIVKSIKKIGSEDLTVEDWRNISHGLQLVVGLNRAAASNTKLNYLKSKDSGGKYVESNKKYSIKTKDGKDLEINSNTLKSLRNAKTPEEANTILKNSLGKEVKIATRTTKFRKKEVLPELPKLVEQGKWDFSRVDSRFKPNGNWFSDANMLQRQVNAELTLSNPYSWLKGKNLNIYNRTKPTPTPTPVIRGYLQQPHSERYNRLLDQKFDTNGIPITPERLQAMGIWKKGGRLPFNKKDDAVVKAQGGINTNWLLLNTGNGQANSEFRGHLNSNASSAIQNGKLDRSSGYTGDIATTSATLTDAYNQQQKYYNTHKIWDDVISAYNYYVNQNPNKTDEDFKNWYNNEVSSLRNYKKTNWNQKYNSSGWNDYNNRFNILYRNYTTGFDPNPKYLGNYGKSTWERYVNTFANDNEFKDYRNGIVGKTNMYMDNNGLLQINNPSTNSTDNKPSNNDSRDNKPKGIITGAQTKTGKGNDIDYKVSDWDIRLLSALKLIGVNTTNAINRKLKKDSLTHYLTDVGEVTSPVVGAYDIMQSKKNQSADLRYLGKDPQFTDLDKILAFKSDLNKQARQIENEGLLADTKRRQETYEQNRKLYYDSVMARIKNANENKARINETNRLRAEVDIAANLKRNKNWSDFITEMQDYRQKKIDNLRNIKYNIIQQRADNKYKEMVKDAYEKAYKASLKPGFDQSTDPDYQNYIKIAEQAEIDRENYINSALYNITGIGGYIPYKSSAKSKLK